MFILLAFLISIYLWKFKMAAIERYENMESSDDEENVPRMVDESQDRDFHTQHANTLIGTSNKASRTERQVVDVATGDVIFKIIWVYY